MSKSTCLYCGVELPDVRWKVCSEHRRMHSTNLLRVRREAGRVVQFCPYCATELGPRSKTCPEHRKQWQADEQKRRVAERRAAQPDRHCLHCKAVLSKLRTDRKLCGSDACKKKHGAIAKAKERERWTEETRLAQRANEKRWRAQNKEYVYSKYRRAYLANPQRYADRRDAWRLANPEKHKQLAKLMQSKRRTLKTSGDSRRVTVREWNRVLNRAEGRCHYCDSKSPLTVDHVVPLARGGRHAIGNLVPACERCNKSKGKLFITEWRKRDAVDSRLSG